MSRYTNTIKILQFSVPILVPQQTIFPINLTIWKKYIKFNSMTLLFKKDSKFMKALKATCCLNENIDDIEK